MALAEPTPPIARKNAASGRYLVLLPFLAVFAVFFGGILDRSLRGERSAPIGGRKIVRAGSRRAVEPRRDSAIPARSQSDPPRILIDVASFAEGISGWRTSLIELMHLARAINGTLVEPCMTNGRLGSCFDHKIPVSQIFDLSEALRPFEDGRPPLLTSHDDYQSHRMAIAEALPYRQYTSVFSYKYNICLNIMKGNPARCSAGALFPEEIDTSKFRKAVMDPGRYFVLQLEDYWRKSSVKKIVDMFGIGNPSPPRVTERTKLLIHPKHESTMEWVLRRANIAGGDFSVVHFRAEKEGMDFMECAKAVVDAKDAMLEKMSNGSSAGESSHPFVLVTSLNEDPDMMWSGSRKVAGRAHNNTAKEALAYLVRDNGFVKIDTLMKQSPTADVQDPGMLAIYDLILATKSKSFATCAKDGGYGCNPSTQRVCNRCNHLGKYGKLALSMRLELGFPRDSSWGCWPQTKE